MYNGGMIELQKTGDKELWDEFLLENGGHPLQLWGWGQVKAAHGWTAERVLAYDDDQIVGAAQILIRRLPLPFRSFAYIPRGPLVDDAYRDEFYNALAGLVKRDYKAVALSVEPAALEFPKLDGWQRSANKVLPAETIVLDISKPESDLLAVMAKKTRQYIRKSAAEGIVIKQVHTREELEKCLHIYRQTAERAQFNLHQNQYYMDVFNLMGDYSPVFAAYLDDQPVAFLWLAISADTAFELYGGMNEDGQRLRANYALKWQVIRKVKEWGLSQYDFGGLVAGGVSTFKQGWSADETVFAGTFDKPLSPTYKLWAKGLPTAKRLLQRLKR
jgi:peptidoglycan pentaglycine glycine transferase (the first glycine)